METKIFCDKKITIRKLSKSDFKKAKEFLDFINSLIAEDAKILMGKKQTLKDEKGFLEKNIKGMRDKTKVYLLAEHNNKIIASTSITLGREKSNHVGGFGISIRNGYRGMGIGEYLMSEIIKLAEKELKPKPKMIRLEVYVNNKPAINLYKKLGFKIVAKLPKQIQWKGKLIDEFVMIKFL
jgi:RimJ/RimL family protein N-acetyltransferase